MAMVKNLLTLFIAAGLVSCACSQILPPISAIYINKELKVNGRLDDPAWSKAQWIVLDGVVSVSENSGLHSDLIAGIKRQEAYKVEAAVLVSPTGVYFGMKARDRDVQASKRKHNDWIWLEDVLEVFIAPPSASGETASKTHYEFQVNACGTKFFNIKTSDSAFSRSEQDAKELEPLTFCFVDGTINCSRDDDNGWQMVCFFSWAQMEKMGITSSNNEILSGKRPLFFSRFSSWDLTIHSILRMNKYTLPGGYNPHQTQYYRPVFIQR
jgi:hypothetical protein